MSIIRCDNCENQIDSDFVDCTELNGKEVCLDCYYEIQGDEEPDYDVENYFEKKARDFD